MTDLSQIQKGSFTDNTTLNEDIIEDFANSLDTIDFVENFNQELNTSYSTEEALQIADINNDGLINQADADTYRETIATSGTNLPKAANKLGDINGDSKLDISDAVVTARYSAIQSGDLTGINITDFIAQVNETRVSNGSCELSELEFRQLVDVNQDGNITVGNAAGTNEAELGDAVSIVNEYMDLNTTVFDSNETFYFGEPNIQTAQQAEAIAGLSIQSTTENMVTYLHSLNSTEYIDLAEGIQSGSLSFQNNTLFINGTDDNNTISINKTNNQLTLDIDGVILNVPQGFKNIEVRGKDGNDVIEIGDKVELNSVSGGTGHDTIINDGSAINQISGGHGNDTLVNKGYAEAVSGMDGLDTIINRANAIMHSALGGSGTDTIYNQGQLTSIQGGNNNDEIVNDGVVTEHINGNDGNDHIMNNGQVASIWGSDGNDRLSNMGIVSSLIDGGSGQDVIENEGNIEYITRSAEDIITHTLSFTEIINLYIQNIDPNNDITAYTPHIIDEIQQLYPENNIDYSKAYSILGLDVIKRLSYFNTTQIEELIKNRYSVSSEQTQQRLEQAFINRPDFFDIPENNKPVAVIIGPEADHNGSFDTMKNITTLMPGYKVIYYDVSSDTEFAQSLQEATQQQQASILYIAGHGSQWSTTFGTGTFDQNDERKLDVGDIELSYLRSCVLDGGNVVFRGCSAGKGGNIANLEVDNSVEFAATIWPQATIYGATVDTTGTHLTLDSQSLFTGVNYNSINGQSGNNILFKVNPFEGAPPSQSAINQRIQQMALYYDPAIEKGIWISENTEGNPVINIGQVTLNDNELTGIVVNRNGYRIWNHHATDIPLDQNPFEFFQHQLALGELDHIITRANLQIDNTVLQENIERLSEDST